MQWVEGMGIATGLAFDKQGSLYVGDRSGTIFKINPEREIFVFRHARTFGLGISSGIRAERRSLRHRPDDFEL